VTTPPLTFLEASKLVDGFSGKDTLTFSLSLSGSIAQLDLFLRAEAARHNLTLNLNVLPFGVLRQHLYTPSNPDDREVFLLCPWDLVATLDWRTGVPALPVSEDMALAEAEFVIDQVQSRQPLAAWYLPAPLPPSGLTPAGTDALALSLQKIIASRGIRILPDFFALGGYLVSGCPLAGRHLGTWAQIIIRSVLASSIEPKKVLVTDLDNTLWAGLISEDGVNGIIAAPNDVGYPHFLYQTLLRKLKESGVLLAVVSRNDAAIVGPAFVPGRMVLEESDFIAMLVSYYPKSTQIAELAGRLNLGLDQFVFVDDNPVELEEVKGALPGVECLAFSQDESGILSLLDRLHYLFRVTEITAEDRQRTKLYQRMVLAAVPVQGCSHDLTSYLAGLSMTLTINDRSRGNRARALQLINKTNQFNLNGRRWDDSEVEALLTSGGKFYTATLADRTGGHGEILAILLDAERTVRAFVMSCRVFQRRIEVAFILWLLGEVLPDSLQFCAQHTDRNVPVWQFLADSSFTSCDDGMLKLNATAFKEIHSNTLELFKINVTKSGDGYV
jgi:FkbH-like protein